MTQSLLSTMKYLKVFRIELEGNSELEIFWFESNYMKLNADKCNLLVSGTKYEHSWAKKAMIKVGKVRKLRF